LGTLSINQPGALKPDSAGSANKLATIHEYPSARNEQQPYMMQH